MNNTAPALKPAQPNTPGDSARIAGAQYRGSAGVSYHKGRHTIPDAAWPWVTRLRAKKFAAHVRPQDVVVEYGVGYGWNLAGLKCSRRIGYDLSDVVAPIVRAHGIEFAGSAQEIGDGAADVVICHHVLEHVATPIETLAEIYRMLAPGGKLLLVVPYEMQRRFRRYNSHDPNNHIYSWTAQSLGNLAILAGFELGPVSINKYGYDRLAAVMADRLSGGEFGFRALRTFGLLLRPWHELRIAAIKR